MKYFAALLFYVFFVTDELAAQNDIKSSTASSNVSLLKKEFAIPNINNKSHKIWIYLPPNYKNTSKKFPVIYMHDAQNLFDATTSFAGEWEVDESLNELFKKTNKGFIVVGIENGGEERINEYTPWENEKYGGGKGEIYIDFLVNDLKPYIDANYRTKKEPAFTGIIGSSLGGLISYYGGLKYPHIFGKIGALSTSFWFSSKVEEFTKENGRLQHNRMYLLVGEKEGYDTDKDSQKMEKILLKTGFNPRNLKLKINPNGEHNEAFWRSEFLEAVKWLYNIK